MKRLNNFRHLIVYIPREDSIVSNSQMLISMNMVKKEQLPNPVEPLKGETAIYHKLGDKTTSELVENLLAAALEHPDLCPYI
jgi:rRNA pseudouridine-1189 N-methylase Emg1 (Nep1/Mra1 family)